MLEIREGPLVGGKAGSICHFVFFSCFAVFGDPMVPLCWEKQHEKSYASRQSTGKMTN